MSNLSIRERYDFNNLSPDLTKSQLQIINARNSEIIKNLISKNNALFYAEILKAFDLALMLAGHKKEESDYFNQVKACSKALESNFNTGKYGSITVNELKIAVERGCSGQYGEFMGINYVTLNKFILGYVQEMNEAITKQRIYEADLKYKREQKEKSERLKAEYQEKFWRFIEADQAEKKANPDKVINDLGSVKCRQLIREGKINLTEEEKESFKEKTLTAYALEISAERQRARDKQVSFGYHPPEGEDEKAKKIRIYYSLVYNEWLIA